MNLTTKKKVGGGAIALVAAASMTGAMVAPAFAFGGKGGDSDKGADKTYRLTLAARECDEYEDIFANRGRNNIQETLLDLGADSQYNSGMNPDVQPSMEEQGRQLTNCRPLEGWKFTTGSGMSGGTPANLSTVTGVNGSAVTEASVPGRNTTSGAFDGSTVQGAVTIDLTEEQIKLATAGSSRLWIQGGTPSAQLNGRTDLSFGALRCSVDALNGDNVEWAQYKDGVYHQYCYALYVNKAPKPATIKITKQVVDAPEGVNAFKFGGNVSYNEGGVFILQPSGPNGSKSETFVRDAVEEGGTPWVVTEDEAANFTLADIKCESNGDKVEFNADVSKRQVSITRLPQKGEISCTFTNKYVAPVTETPTETPTNPSETPTNPAETPTDPTNGPTDPAVTPTDPTNGPTDPAVTPTDSASNVDDGSKPGQDSQDSQDNGTLAKTGAELAVAVLIAMIAIAVGTMMVLTSRRRSRKH